MQGEHSGELLDAGVSINEHRVSQCITAATRRPLPPSPPLSWGAARRPRGSIPIPLLNYHPATRAPGYAYPCTLGVGPM
jgi:hypothetical protein